MFASIAPLATSWPLAKSISATMPATWPETSMPGTALKVPMALIAASRLPLRASSTATPTTGRGMEDMKARAISGLAMN